MHTRTGSMTARRAAGFTLIELMITLVIAAILTAIAIPAYTNAVRKSRRTEARAAVLDLASREERFLSTANTYSATPTDLGYSGATWAAVGAIGGGYYTLNVTAGAGPSYSVTATAAGNQALDTDCKTFSVNQIGQQTSLNSGGADSTDTCWK